MQSIYTKVFYFKTFLAARPTISCTCTSKFAWPLVKNQLRLSHSHRKDGMMEFLKERIGNREIVGYGFNGQPCYVDRADYPFPSIRFQEPSAEYEALRLKEKGDWKLLSLEEKKKLYRYSYCQTFSEFLAPTTLWMYVTGWVLIGISAAMWFYIFQRVFVFDELPDTFAEERQRAQLARMIDIQVNPITGLASKWDYQKNDWKHKGWGTPPNPFTTECDDEAKEQNEQKEQKEQ